MFCVYADVQEMFLEIEQKVTSLGLASDHHQQQQQQQNELGAVGSQQEAVELLFSKLELLKANLVCFQQLLQDRQGEEMSVTCEQVRCDKRFSQTVVTGRNMQLLMLSVRISCSGSALANKILLISVFFVFFFYLTFSVATVLMSNFGRKKKHDMQLHPFMK